MKKVVIRDKVNKLIAEAEDYLSKIITASTTQQRWLTVVKLKKRLKRRV
ncbi:MAG: hypothetical protein ACLRR3_01490 [Eubacterium sp.]